MSNRSQGVRGGRGGRGARGARGGRWVRGGGSGSPSNTSLQKPPVQQIQVQNHGGLAAPLADPPAAPFAAPPTVPHRADSVTASTTAPRVYKHLGAPTNLFKKDVQALFRRNARKDNEQEMGKVNVHLVPSSFGYKVPDPADLDLLKLLKQTGELHHVKISMPAGASIILFNARSQLQADQAIQTVLSSLQSQAYDSEARHPQILVAPVLRPRDVFKVQLEKAPTGARPVCPPNTGSKDEPDGNKLQLLGKEYQDTFQHKMFQVVESLRSNSTEMQMRVRFGTLRLQEWKKDKDTYSYAGLETLARRVGLRGTFKLDEFIGAEKYNDDLKTKICSLTSYFEPVTSRIPSLEVVPAKHTLVLRSLGLDLETEVIDVLDNDQATVRYRLGPIRGYRREKRHQAVEIITACPEWRHDWGVEVRTQVKVESLPFTHRDLEINTRLTARDQSSRFPELAVFRDFAMRSSLEEIMGKTSILLRIKDTSYVVEVSLFHKWHGPSTNDSATVGCGVTLRGVLWDEELGPKNIAEGRRAWGDDFEELFPKDDGQGGLEGFLRCVEEIHRILGEVGEVQAA